ncbi:hypothetical protein ACPCAJ_16820, partial [Streptomyces griseoincarnatus]
LAWCALLLAVFVPLAVRQYAKGEGERLRHRAGAGGRGLADGASGGRVTGLVRAAARGVRAAGGTAVREG